MIGSFSFNNVESSGFNLVCKSVKRPLLPAKKVNRTEKVGASGAYDFDDNEYSLRVVTMKIAYIGTTYQELRVRARAIAAWLSTKTWVKLIIHDEPDKYYLAKVTSEISLESLWESGTADIVFDCQPFAYSLTELDVTRLALTDTTAINFTNPGTRDINFKSPQGSKFSITVTGSWTTLTFACNGQTLTYSKAGVAETLVLNNVDMTVIQNGSSFFASLTGDVDTFLSIIPGANTITVGGTGLSIDVKISYIPLWI